MAAKREEASPPPPNFTVAIGIGTRCKYEDQAPDSRIMDVVSNHPSRKSIQIQGAALRCLTGQKERLLLFDVLRPQLETLSQQTTAQLRVEQVIFSARPGSTLP